MMEMKMEVCKDGSIGIDWNVFQNNDFILISNDWIVLELFIRNQYTCFQSVDAVTLCDRLFSCMWVGQWYNQHVLRYIHTGCLHRNHGNCIVCTDDYWMVGRHVLLHI